MKEHSEIVSKTLMVSVNPEISQLVNEQRFAEVRDYWKKRLEQLEEKRVLALNTDNRGVYEETWELWREALRNHDRYYVLADLKSKGLWTKRGW